MKFLFSIFLLSAFTLNASAQTDSLYNPYQAPASTLPGSTSPANKPADNFLDMSSQAGQANGPANGGGIGNGRGGGLSNNPNAPIDPGPDPGIPLDGGIVFLLLGGAILGTYQLFKTRPAQA